MNKQYLLKFWHLSRELMLQSIKAYNKSNVIEFQDNGVTIQTVIDGEIHSDIIVEIKDGICESAYGDKYPIEDLSMNELYELIKHIKE